MVKSAFLFLFSITTWNSLPVTLILNITVIIEVAKILELTESDEVHL